MRKNPNFKVILVGDGSVGSSFAFAMTLKGLGKELGIIDMNKNKTIGDAMDLNPAITYNATKKIYSAEYSDCADADIVVITASAPQNPGETRLDLVYKNLKIIKSVVSEIIKSGFDGISRFVGVDPRDVSAYIMGEHGDTSFSVWSNASIGGKKVEKWIKEKTDYLESAKEEIYANVRDVAYKIINTKGATYYGVATVLAKICRIIIEDSHSIITVGAYLDGEYVFNDIYMGTPVILGRNGIEKIIEIDLSEEEHKLMETSYKTLKTVQEEGLKKLEEE